MVIANKRSQTTEFCTFFLFLVLHLVKDFPPKILKPQLVDRPWLGV
jgi:hypothetical protein